MPSSETGYSFLFVINSHAGGKEKSGWITQIATYFEAQRQHVISFYKTTGKDDAIAIMELLKKENYDRIIAVGGDGTFKMVAEIAAKFRKTAGMIPGGSANGMAAELGIPTNLPKALETICAPHTLAIDAIRINGEFSIHMSDAGLNAQLIAYFEQANERGMMGYAKEVAKTLRNSRVVSAGIHVDGRYIRRRAAMILIANGRTYGTGVIVNESGSFTDGHFEVIVLRQVTLWRILHSLIYRKATPGPHQQVFPCKKLHIRLARRMPFQVDGEYLGSTRNIEAEIMPKCVSVLTTKEAP